jgi:hypothetical protein
LSPDAPTTTDDALALVFEAEGCAMATWKNLTLVVWATQATLGLSRQLEVVSTDLIRAHPRGISSVHLIADKTPLPGADARNHLQEITVRYAADLACIGTVIDGDGFWASAMRSFLRSLHWLSRRPFKAHYAGNIAELAEWLPAHHVVKTGVAIQPAELAAVLHDLAKRVRRPARQSA